MEAQGLLQTWLLHVVPPTQLLWIKPGLGFCSQLDLPSELSFGNKRHTSYSMLQAFHFETIMKISKYRKVKRNSNRAPCIYPLSDTVTAFPFGSTHSQGFMRTCPHELPSSFMSRGPCPISVVLEQPLLIFWSLRLLFVSSFSEKWILWVWMISKRKGGKCWLMQACSCWESEWNTL